VQTLTMKFGGTSVGSVAAIRQAMAIIRQARDEQANRTAVIASAMSGVTNLLQDGLHCAIEGNTTGYNNIAETMTTRHQEAADALLTAEREPVMAEIEELIEDFTQFCDSVRVLGEAPPRARAYTLGLGERMNVRLVAAALRQDGIDAQAVDATDLIVTDDRYENAAPFMEETRNKTRRFLAPLFDRGIVPIITGFIGATPDGTSTTLGRGGSDYSAAIVGVCLDSDEVWIWTDVDGVMSADPRIVPEARTIDRLSQQEVSELAYFGAKVLHPKTIRPVLEADIKLVVKNTFNPDHPGTLIVPNGQATGEPIKAVTAIRDMSLITVEGKGMMGVPGIAARTFGAVARTGTSVLIISQSSSEQNICFVVPQGSVPLVVETLSAEFKVEMARRDIDQIKVQDEITIITVVGAGMLQVPGIAGRIFTATGKSGVNVIVIAQGSSECGISMAVTAQDADNALRAIHPLTQGG
jgi:aspartokinase/homoserine dehydrogenase 1